VEDGGAVRQLSEPYQETDAIRSHSAIDRVDVNTCRSNSTQRSVNIASIDILPVYMAWRKKSDFRPMDLARLLLLDLNNLPEYLRDPELLATVSTTTTPFLAHQKLLFLCVL